MVRYTVDAVALLVYLVDALPRRADQLFAEAEAGETDVEAPSTALAEVLYSVSRDKDVRGVALSVSSEKARQALVSNGSIAVADMGDEEIAECTQVVNEFSIHDGLVVASHRVADTEAVITTDGVIDKAGVDTVWN